MQRVDDILGGGSAYAFDKLQRFGVVQLPIMKLCRITTIQYKR